MKARILSERLSTLKYSMKRNRLLKHLKNHGCELYREGGNHTVFINVNSKKCSTIPRHSEISNKLVRKICKDLEISEIP